MAELAMMTIAEVSGLIAEKKVSPVEVVDACQARIDERSEELLAYCTLTAESAREKAKQAEKEIMKDGPKSPMHGIPYGLKDMFYTKDILTTGGSNFLRDFRPDYSATVAQRCDDAGAVLMGKTNTHELAFAPIGLSCFGQSKNPYDTSRIPGGSSSGSAIAVATGMAYMAMGTDTGGSIRIPAALCGVVGYKPTYGLTSQYGVIPLSYTLDHIGPLTRSVMDAAITIDVISGTDPMDPCQEAIKRPPTQFAGELQKTDGLKGRKIGVPLNFFRDKIDAEVERLYLEALEALKELGAELVHIEIPFIEEIPPLSSLILFSEAAHYHRKRMEEQLDGFGKMQQDRLKNGASWSAVDYIDTMRKREKIRKEWEEIMKDLDVVAVPTVPVQPPLIGSDTTPCKHGDEPTADILVRHTRLGTFAGIPALTIPSGLTKEGFPAAIMFYGGKNRDLDVLGVGWAYEKHYGFPSLA